MEQHQQQLLQQQQQHGETTVVGDEDGSDAASLKNEQAEVDYRNPGLARSESLSSKIPGQRELALARGRFGPGRLRFGSAAEGPPEAIHITW